MGRFLWSQLVHRKSRTATLGLGILVAAVGFTLLTSAVNTSALEIRGTVAQNFRSAYDILVRPSDSYTPLEQSEGLVRDNYLSGIFGGITFSQYHEIRSIPGVEVAAPIANIGYVMPFQFVPLTINRFLSKQPVQMYRLRFEWSANNGISRYPDNPWYVYYTRRDRFVSSGLKPPSEVLPSGRRVSPCLSFNKSHPRGPLSPFQLVAGTGLACFSAKTPDIQETSSDYGPLPPGRVGVVSTAFFPLLIAAIDPAQEERLVGIDDSLASGRMLDPGDRPTVEVGANGGKYLSVPFVASTRTYLDEVLHVTIEGLRLPRPPTLYARLSSETHSYRFVTTLPAERTLGTETIPIGQLYQHLLRTLSLPISKLTGTTYTALWGASSTDYRGIGPDRLAAVPTTPSTEAFFEAGGYYGPGWAPMENRDVHFRLLKSYQATSDVINGVLPSRALHVVGRFDPTKLPGFNPLSRVPLETYYPPQVEPADQTSREALGGMPLFPTQNVGGYVAQPPLMLTTLQGLRAFASSAVFPGPDPTAPISVIRVRVAGVTGPDPLSLARIKQVALAIHQTTGLSVDITAGSSPTPMTVELPPGRFGQPALTVTEGWVKKGVAIVILQALDRKSVALFLLVLVVTGLFLVNGGMAAVRTRRTEIGTLLALGWSRGKVFRAVLSELALIGLAAGVVGTLLAAALVEVLGFRMPLARTLLVAPVATTLAVLAGFVPAWRASRCLPIDAVRPAVADSGSGRPVRGVASMALANLRRLPGRTLLGAAGLFVGVGALALLLSITLAFRGTLVGTALGTFISVQVRGVDYLGVGLAMGLAALSVADVLFLNLKERAPEIVTLQASGWRDAHITRLVSLEGLGIGVIGSVAGALAGLGLSSLVGVSAAHIAGAGAIAALAGVGVAVAASLLPASLASRMTAPMVLAEE